MLKMQTFRLLIGLIFVGNGFGQLFEYPAISSDDDLLASPATFFGPKSLGFTATNLGNFGPLGYGGIGGMRIGSIGPIHYGYIGGIHTDPFLGAPNPNAEEEEFPGTTDTLSEDEYEQDFIGNPMEQNWQEMNDEPNFVGMEPDEQEMLELGPQMPENSRAFIKHGLFGVNKHRPLTFISALHYPNYSGSYSGHRGSYSGHRGSSDIHSHGQYDYDSHDHDYGNYGSGQGHGYNYDDDFRSFGSHKHGYDHGSHKYGYDHGSHKHRYDHGSSNAYGHGSHKHQYDHGSSNAYGHGYRGSHKHGNSHVISHGSGFGSSQGNGHSSNNIYELSHGVPADVYQAIYKKYGSHSHGPHASNNHMSHKGLHNFHSKFRSNDEMEETMMPNSYDFDQTEFEDMNQAPIFK